MCCHVHRWRQAVEWWWKETRLLVSAWRAPPQHVTSGRHNRYDRWADDTLPGHRVARRPSLECETCASCHIRRTRNLWQEVTMWAWFIHHYDTANICRLSSAVHCLVYHTTSTFMSDILCIWHTLNTFLTLGLFRILDSLTLSFSANNGATWHDTSVKKTHVCWNYG